MRGRGSARLACSTAAVLAVVLAGCSAPTTTSDRVEAREVAVGDGPERIGLPNAVGSVKFAVIGDGGRGWRPQHEIAARMAEFGQRFRFSFVLMAGDNIYEGPATPEDYRLKFEEPYRELLDAGVTFHAVLGNHDDPDQRHYPPFNMGGHRYYTFRRSVGLLPRLGPDVQIFALDSTELDGDQVAWLRRELARSDARWKIVLMHHPLYTPGRYQAQSRITRWQIESTLVEGGVDAVFSGHEHLFARSEPQRGVHYFISGAAGSLRKGDARPRPWVARAFDEDFHFILVEVERDAMHVRAIARTGRTVDAVALEKPASGVSVRDMAGPR